MKDLNLGRRVKVTRVEPDGDRHVHAGGFVGHSGQIVRGSYAHGYQVRLDMDAPGLSHLHLHPVAPVQHPSADEIAQGKAFPTQPVRRADEIVNGRCLDCGVTHPAPAGVLHFFYATDLVQESGAALEAEPCRFAVATGPLADDGCRDCYEEIRSGRSGKSAPEGHPLHRPGTPRP